MRQTISVVYVEDDPDIRELVAIAFDGESDMKMVTFEPTADVIERIRAAAPDLVLLDVMMPGVDGRMLAKRMKADTTLCKVPFVFITAKARPQEQVELRELQPLAVFPKPFDVLALPQSLRTLLAQSRNADVE